MFPIIIIENIKLIMSRKELLMEKKQNLLRFLKVQGEFIILSLEIEAKFFFGFKNHLQIEIHKLKK